MLFDDFNFKEYKVYDRKLKIPFPHAKRKKNVVEQESKRDSDKTFDIRLIVEGLDFGLKMRVLVDGDFSLNVDQGKWLN